MPWLPITNWVKKVRLKPTKISSAETCAHLSEYTPERAAEITGSLLNLARPEETSLERVECGNAIREVVQLFEPQIRGRGIGLDLGQLVARANLVAELSAQHQTYPRIDGVGGLAAAAAGCTAVVVGSRSSGAVAPG